MVHPRPVALLFLAFASLALSSKSMAQLQTGNVHVYVTYLDDRAPTEQMKVELISGQNGNQVAQTFTNDHGEAEFFSVTIGNYKVVVSGNGIQSTDSDEFEVDARKSSQSIFVRVQPSSDRGGNAAPGHSTVPASDLRVPKDASKEFDKATRLMSQGQWQKAIERLNKALAIFPDYTQAYTNLGVVYAHLSDWDREREALNKAVAINGQYAPALLNLGVLNIRQKDYANAERLLARASAADPTDVKVLAWLSQAELLDGHYDAAIANAQKVHSMAHAGYASVHYISARALLHENRTQDAVSQFQLMLAEEPTGARADAVRKELTVLQASPQ